VEVSCLRLHLHLHVFSRDSRREVDAHTACRHGAGTWRSELAGVSSTVCDAVAPSVGVSFVVD
jgi:anti-sigma-K factor RskA